MTAIENYINELKTAGPLSFIETYRYKNTKDIALPKYMASIQEPTIIIVPYWRNLLLFSPAVLAGAICTYALLSTNKWELSLLLTLAGAGTLIYLTIRDKKTPKIPVVADHDTLKFKNYTFLWKNIANSYILYNDASKKVYKSLVLEDIHGEINKIPFDDDEIQDKKLASIIEYYKRKYPNV
jgi:hypothetical protein